MNVRQCVTAGFTRMLVVSGQAAAGGRERQAADREQESARRDRSPLPAQVSIARKPAGFNFYSFI